ncbi:hypothetical protein BaRGS_00006746 [Batillaria attramentaria]|uniref:Uncharacterized protein n=1 Tax=Batillaria attramentaria TaxID=370345 RepID=A0ABD0LQN0_9CAEN
MTTTLKAITPTKRDRRKCLCHNEAALHVNNLHLSFPCCHQASCLEFRLRLVTTASTASRGYSPRAGTSDLDGIGRGWPANLRNVPGYKCDEHDSMLAHRRAICTVTRGWMRRKVRRSRADG